MSAVTSGLLIVWGLACAGVTLAAAIYCTRRYSHPDVHWSIKATVAVSYFFSFSVIYLIALDVNPDARTGLSVLWRLEFWFIQFATWIWAGGQQDYFDAGEFDWRGIFSVLIRHSHSNSFLVAVLSRVGLCSGSGKLKYSVKINLKILGIAGFFGVIFLVYVAIATGMDQEHLVGFVVALANTIGLTLLIMLLGTAVIHGSRLSCEQ